MDQTQREFLIEIEDLIEQIFDDLDELRRKHHNGRLRRELLSSIFRRVHTVKGAAFSSALDRLAETANEFETLLAAVRDGRVELANQVLDTFDDAGKALADSLTAAETGDVEPEPTALFDRIRTLANEDLPIVSELARVLKELPSDFCGSLSEQESRHLAESLSEGKRLFFITSRFRIENFDTQFYRLKESLARQGEIIVNSPAINAESDEMIDFRFLYASDFSAQQIEQATKDFLEVTVNEVGFLGPLADKSGIEWGWLDRKSAPASSSIRVEAAELDRLISSTYELFRLTTAALDLAGSNPDAQIQKTIQARAERIKGSFRALENEVISLRMIALERVLKRAVRAGRAAARLAGKEIDFELRGTEFRTDKLLAAAIADPLLHLVRNAVDHGIETTAERLQAGKTQRGRVIIEAFSDDSRTRVRVSDDGRGIDPEVVYRVAVRSGIIDEGSRVDMDRSLRLIFRPGFSTTPVLSNVSGRGVGLDVVEAAVEEVGGGVRVSSDPGHGSVFEISLPLTFGLLSSTVVFSADTRYCLDTSRITSISSLESDRIAIQDGVEVLRSNGEVVPVIHLRQLLGQPKAEPTDNRVDILFCRFSDKRIDEGREKQIAIVVDGVDTQEEVLVRGLGRHAARWQGIAGATELSNGAVALVLDLPRLL